MAWLKKKDRINRVIKTTVFSSKQTGLKTPQVVHYILINFVFMGLKIEDVKKRFFLIQLTNRTWYPLINSNKNNTQQTFYDTTTQKNVMILTPRHWSDSVNRKLTAAICNASLAPSCYVDMLQRSNYWRHWSLFW